MRRLPRGRRPPAHLVTEAPQSLSQDISNRERRYLIMMGIRVLCFLAAIGVFALGGGWFSLIPAVGAVVIPYFAVVIANAGREPTKTRGLGAHQPLPTRGDIAALPYRDARPHIPGQVVYDADHTGDGAHRDGDAQSGGPEHP